MRKAEGASQQLLPIPATFTIATQANGGFLTFVDLSDRKNPTLLVPSPLFDYLNQRDSITDLIPGYEVNQGKITWEAIKGEMEKLVQDPDAARDFEDSITLKSMTVSGLLIHMGEQICGKFRMPAASTEAVMSLIRGRRR